MNTSATDVAVHTLLVNQPWCARKRISLKVAGAAR
jgi:hypothetical protein